MKPFGKEEDGTWLFKLFSEPDNDKDAQKMALQYAISKFKLVGKETTFVDFITADDDRLIAQKEYIRSFPVFASTFSDLLKVFIANFNRTYTVME